SGSAILGCSLSFLFGGIGGWQSVSKGDEIPSLAANATRRDGLRLKATNKKIGWDGQRKPSVLGGSPSHTQPREEPVPMPLRNLDTSSRRKWLPHALLLLAFLLVGAFITLRSLHGITQENRQKLWFEQEVKARDEFKQALVAMVVFVDYRERLIEGGRTPQDEFKFKLEEIDAHLDQAKREAEKLRPMLPGLADRQRFEKRLADLLKSLENTRGAAQAVARAKNQEEIRQTLKVFAQ